MKLKTWYYVTYKDDHKKHRVFKAVTEVDYALLPSVGHVVAFGTEKTNFPFRVIQILHRTQPNDMSAIEVQGESLHMQDIGTLKKPKHRDAMLDDIRKHFKLVEVGE